MLVGERGASTGDVLVENMEVITPIKEVRAQRQSRVNAWYGTANEDVLEHLRSIQRGSKICDPRGKRIEVVHEPWGWIETDNHGRTHGANVRKEAAVHEAGHCVSAFVLGSYPEEARVFKSRGAKSFGYFHCLASIHGCSIESVRRTVETTGFTQEQGLLAASCRVIELCAGVEAAKHVGGVARADEKGFNDDWKTRNLLDVFPDLDECYLRGLAAELVVFYASAVKAVAIELYRESRLFTNALLSAAVSGFGPDFRIHPRNRWALNVGPYGAGLH